MRRVVIPGFRKIETRSSGEGGTTNYDDLANKPSINNVPLVGNLNTANLKLTDATLTEEGVPAEAKTVGTKLEEQSTSLTSLSEQLGNHTVKSDVPENAVFTDTVYDDTEVKGSIDELNSNLDGLGYGENSGGRNIFQLDKIKCGSMVENDLVLANQASEFYEYNWKPNTQYTISGITKNSNSSGRQRLYFKYTDGTNSEAFANFGTDFAFTSLTSDVGKTIKSLNSYWGDNGSLIIKDAEIMIEEGTQAAPYEPYIPSVKMLAEEVDKQNASLSDYGLDNKCSNLVNGYYNADDGSLVTNYNPLRYICSTNSYYLKKGETIRVNGNSVDSIYISKYDTNGSFINRIDYYDKKDVTYIAQDNIIIKWSVSFSTDTPINQSPHIGVYVDNAIDELKNDLDKLSSLPIGSIIQIEAAKDNIETTTQKYGWQYLGTSNIECNDGSLNLLVTNVYRKNN